MRAASQRSATARLLYVAAGLLFLLAVVALASRGHAPPAGGGRSHARAASQILFDFVFTAVVLGMPLVVLVMVYVRARATGSRSSSWRSAIVMVAFVAAFSLAAVFGGRFYQHRLGGHPFNIRQPPSATKLVPKPTRPARPHFDWPFGAGVLALLLVAGAVPLVKMLRRRRRTIAEVQLAEELAVILDDTLDDLRREPDPRRAVIAAYARMESALAVHGLPRLESEAPLEYLSRVLLELTASEHAVRTLTELFEHAKFSDHEVAPEMKEEAIDALAALRDDLRAVDRPGDTPTLRTAVREAMQ